MGGDFLIRKKKNEIIFIPSSNDISPSSAVDKSAIILERRSSALDNTTIEVFHKEDNDPRR